MLKNEFRLECKCGQQLFSIYADVEGECLEIRYDDCGERIATIPSYAVNWKKEDADGIKSVD